MLVDAEARGSEKANGPFGQVLVCWRERAERVPEVAVSSGSLAELQESGPDCAFLSFGNPSIDWETEASWRMGSAGTLTSEKPPEVASRSGSGQIEIVSPEMLHSQIRLPG